MAKRKNRTRQKFKLPGRLPFNLPGRFNQGILSQTASEGAGRGTLTGEKINRRTKELAQGREIKASQLEQQKIQANKIAAQKLEAQDALDKEKARLARRNILQRGASTLGKGLLGVGRFALGPVGLIGTGAYYGARALGYDPFGLNTPQEQQQTAVVGDTDGYNPKPEEEQIRFMQTLSPSYESTGREVLNAALLRAGLTLGSGGSFQDSLQSALSVADSQRVFRTGAEALSAGQRNLGKGADVYVKQNADGTFTYTGSVEANPMDKMRQMYGAEAKVITPQIIAETKKANPGMSDEDIISNLEDNGFTNPTTEE